MKTILKTSGHAVTLAVVFTAGALLTGCSEMSAVMNDLQSMTTSNPTKQSVAQPTNKTVVSAQTTVSSKTDLVGLVGWFENSCGFDQASYTEGTKENQVQKRFNAFQESFMAKQYKPNGSYTAYVKPDYRSKLPANYREAIKNISVVEDDEGVHYYVDFNNATYRGYGLSRLELFYQPESDYVYNALYFKNDNFLKLQPIFKTTRDDVDELRGGNFNAKNRSVMCYLGL
ncbi:MULTISPECIES: hypothetical protein [unclassified Psychrobacter]|uniref:hypothetical protein n=1 Tax=unclassified Psychrobacter TaxID=196806 RepID=UPI0007149752|nr:hypothetical protein [Psychrobacter sp. P11F6]KRG34086.1 hypothetical protein AK822_03950 [Psychrobacter sp. P11F6]